MKILYIAYSCSPNHGSEDRIGWKIPLFSSQQNDVYVITKQEHKKEIEAYQKQHPQMKVQFWFVDIPSVYKKVFRGFAYSGRLHIWQKNAYILAQRICEQKQIDLIHQITPVEFRNIGSYGTIPGVRFVCGPVGGGEYIPKCLWDYARKHVLEECIRTCMNNFGIRRIQKSGIAQSCDQVLFANQETKQLLEPLMGNAGHNSCCFTEIGIDQNEILEKPQENEEGKNCTFLVAGRMIYRKGHALLLEALSELPAELDYSCKIVGNGPEMHRLQKLTRKYGLEQKVSFCGKVPFAEMEKIYAQADVLVMPSIRETTGSVLLEAMARGIPVLTIGHFGGAVVVKECAGWLYNGKTKSAVLADMRELLAACIKEPAMVSAKGKGALAVAQENTWERKMMHYQSLYNETVQSMEEYNG